MKCWRVLYKPDNTAFMVWAYTESSALIKAMKRNQAELNDPKQYDLGEDNYIVDEFNLETNGSGVLAFYDCYSVYERTNVSYNNRIQ